MNDWVPASRRTKTYVWIACSLWMVAAVAGILSEKSDDVLGVVCHGLLLVVLLLSWGITLWAALQCRNPRLRLGWLLVAGGQILSLGTYFMVLTAYVQPNRPYDGAAPLLTVAFLMIGVGLAVGVASVGGSVERRTPLLQAVALAAFVFLLMTAALLAPGATMPFAIGPRDVVALFRLAIDCGITLLVSAYATLLQLRLPDGHRARSWMWAAASAMVAAMGDVGAPLVDLGHGQIYPGLLWCLGGVLLTLAAALAADFELAESPAEARQRVAKPAVALAGRIAEPVAEPAVGAVADSADA